MDELSVNSELSEAEPATADEVKERINNRVKEIYGVTPDGQYFPYMCLVCDKFLKHKEIQDTAKEQACC
jgi:hypothetical protein